MNPEGVRFTVSVSLAKHLANETRVKIHTLSIHPDISLVWCYTLLEWQRKTITRDGCKEYTLTRNCKRVLREGLTLYRSSIAGACISPEAKQIIHALRKQRTVSTSVSLPSTEDKKMQAGS